MEVEGLLSSLGPERRQVVADAATGQATLADDSLITKMNLHSRRPINLPFASSFFPAKLFGFNNMPRCKPCRQLKSGAGRVA